MKNHILTLLDNNENIRKESVESEHELISERIALKDNKMKIIPFNKDNSNKNTLQIEENKISQPENKSIHKEIDNKLKIVNIFRKIVDSNIFISFMTIQTVIGLFSNDIQVAWLPSSVDAYIDILQTIMLFFFTLEIIMTSIANKDYINSFFFWLDICATVSLIQDISFIFNSILNAGTRSDDDNSAKPGNMNLAFLKVSSASRATRVLKIIRIIRLIRIVKLYKNAILAAANIEKKKKEKEELLQKEKEMKEIGNDTGTSNSYNNSSPQSPAKRRNSAINLRNDFNININGKRISAKNFEMMKKRASLIRSKLEKRTEPNNKDVTIDKLIKESKISKVLSESITKKVIILILAMLIVMPIISDDFYQDDTTNSYNLLANYISNIKIINEKKLLDDEFLNRYIIQKQDYDYPIVNMTILDNLYFTNYSINNYDYRSSELRYAISESGDIQITYSILVDSQVNGILGVIKTIFVCILLTGAAVLFENDTKDLVLGPLEVMIEIVENVAKDPINAKNIENLQTGVKNTLSKLSEKKLKKKEEQIEKYEVKIIQSAILKISALLAIGFGEAGGEIITENLSSHQDLNPMLSGKRKHAIFGFCDIRGFAAVNEILQEKTMVFVNEIADIVHSSVDRYGGSANKNIGDAFLVVWKFSNNHNARRDSIVDISKKSSELSNRTCQTQADMAVLGYLKIIIRINKDNRILAYKENPTIKEKLSNYKVNMGFGLHLGWAIEGAVGSTFKMDASYLSPNVNMAARLEAATRQYGVSILISGQLYDYLSEELKNICRHIDTVEVKGSKIPLRLYTIDVNLDLKPSKKSYTLNLEERQKLYQQKKEDLIKEVEEFDACSVLYTKMTFKELLNTKRPRKFYKNFKDGIDYYLFGDWGKASKLFKRCLEIVKNDKPTTVLLDYMNQYNFIAPKDWKGYRSLTSK